MSIVRFFVPIIALLATPLLRAAPPESKPLRVLCWNIHHGAGGDGKLDLERIAAVIRKAKPDLVALQEVDDRCVRTGKTDQCAELARLTGMTGVFGKAMDFQGGAYGQAILSRHPILRSRVHPLPGPSEPRIAFEASISVSGTAIRLVSVHLGLNAKERISQAGELVKLLGQRPDPMIVCGDFNDVPDSPVLEIIAREWAGVLKNPPAFTAPADHPKHEIDHVFARGFSPSTPVQVLEESVASDHRPLLAEFVRK